jgi:acyl dehydratase
MTADSFTVPMHERYFEDYIPGKIYEYGPVRISEEAIVNFAKKYDAQSMHTDPQAAAKGYFGGLIASGWHTTSIAMQLYLENFIPSTLGNASPGVDEIRWMRPVRPGDALSIRVTVLECRLSESKPSLGMVRVLVEVTNQDGELVMSLKPMSLLRCRTAPPQ